MRTKLNEVDEFFILGNKDTLTITELSKKLDVSELSIGKFIQSRVDTKSSKKTNPSIHQSKGYKVLTETDSQIGDLYAGKGITQPPDRIHRPKG